MKNLKSLLHQPLTWSFVKRKMILSSNDQVIIELNEEKMTRASFELNHKSYVLRNEGFWNPKTIIEKDGVQIMILKRRFLGGKGEIEFANGGRYIAKVRNAPLVTLSFYTTDGKEILNYKLETKLKPVTRLNILDHSVNENELLMLTILGAFSFKGVVIEHETSDLVIMIA